MPIEGCCSETYLYSAADRPIAPIVEVVIPMAARSNSSGGGKSKWLRQFLDTKTPTTITSCTIVRLEPKCAQLLLYITPPPHLFLGFQKLSKCTPQSLSGCASDDHGWLWYSHGTFELRKFWKTGGPLIFEDDETAAIEHDISPEMSNSPTGRLEPVNFANESVKALLQLDRADEILHTALDESEEQTSFSTPIGTGTSPATMGGTAFQPIQTSLIVSLAGDSEILASCVNDGLVLG
ncbi:hypothetical protein B0H14DRAFT_2560425 [Mycena olivaceomarginata]|nr:hypothetical protein B0H14DRAFT_2560425 [Mycena olivaceomarginata]